MNARMEELLYLLLWTCDMVTQPTYRNLTGSFEGWLYRNGLHRRVARLERRDFLQTRRTLPGGSGRERLIRLTEAGRLHALGGRDPNAQWRRHWDGQWRLVVFDVSNSDRALRDRLRDHLRRRGFGAVQRSVWITPDPINEEHAMLGSATIDVRSLLFWEGRPCAGETNEQIVSGAWDFAKINRAYSEHASVLKECPSEASRVHRSAETLRRWCAAERTAWLDAVTKDPLLPKALLPGHYLGTQAWKSRCEVLGKLSKRIRSSDIQRSGRPAI